MNSLRYFSIIPLTLSLLAWFPLAWSDASDALTPSIFIQPDDPTISDEIMVFYSPCGCSGRTRVKRTREQIDIVAIYDQGDREDACLSLRCNQVTLGRLPVGNYRLTFYYQRRGSASRNSSVSELFAVRQGR